MLLAIAPVMSAAASPRTEPSYGQSTGGKETISIKFAKRSKDAREIEWLAMNTDLGIPLFEVTIAGNTVCSTLDTNAVRSLVDADVLAAAGLESTETRESAKIGTAEHNVRKTYDLAVNVQGQFSFRGNLFATQLPNVECTPGRKLGFLLGKDILDHVAFATDAKHKRILFVKSGGFRPEEDRYVRIEWKDRRIVGTLDKTPVLLNIALAQRPAIKLETEHFARVFPDQEIQPLSEAQETGTGRSVLKGVPSAKLDIGPLSLTSPVLAGENDDDPAEGTIGFTVFAYFLAIFDAGQNQVLIRIPDVPGDADQTRAADD